MNLSRISTAMTCVVLASPAFAHLHINLLASDTAADTPLEISFYGSDTFAIVDTGSRLEFQNNGSLFTLTTDTTVGTQYDALIPGISGYQRADMPNFSLDGLAPGVQNLKSPGDRTSDPNAESYGFQIVDVVDVSTGNSLDDEYRVLWQHISDHGHLGLPGEYNGYATMSADFSADDVIGRSYILSLGTHAHGGASPDSGFFLFTDAPNGEYDISLSAVDFAGHFADSDPVTFRLSVVPEPASFVLLGLSGIVLFKRRR